MVLLCPIVDVAKTATNGLLGAMADVTAGVHILENILRREPVLNNEP